MIRPNIVALMMSRILNYNIGAACPATQNAVDWMAVAEGMDRKRLFD